MKLSDLKIKQKAKIIKLNSNDDLKQRFYSFGIIKGVEIFVQATSLARNTMEIIVEDTSIALRINEASKIEVEEIL